MASPQWASTSSTTWSTAGNWSTGSAPVTADNAYLRNNSISIDAGLAQSAVTLANLQIDNTYTGLLATSSAYLAISATNWRIGDPSGSGQASTGSQRLKIDFGSNQFTGVVVNGQTSGSSTDTGLEPLRILGTHASNKLYMLGGRMGVATTLPSEVSTLSVWSVSGTSTVLNLGPGVTWTTGYQVQGNVSIRSGGTTFNQEAGTATAQGSDVGVIRTMSIGGTIYLNQRPSSKTVTFTRSSTTATGTATGHGYSNGDTIYISGANEANYNGYQVISNVAANTFDFTISSTAPTPATGTILATKAIASMTILESGTVDVSQDARDIYVAAIIMYPGATIIQNAANIGHLHYGTLTPVSTGTITAQ